jgi:hypothetical protein
LIVAVVVFNVSLGLKVQSRNLSDITVAKVEALAQESDGGTLPEVVISCGSSSTYGPCWKLEFGFANFCSCGAKCVFTGSTPDHCSWYTASFINVCLLFI